MSWCEPIHLPISSTHSVLQETTIYSSLMILIGSSFQSRVDRLTSSQWAQNSVSNPASGVRHVTIRQLLDAIQTNNDAAPFEIHRFPVKRVMLVANVYPNEPNSSSGFMRYDFDDGSGKISGNRWPEKEGDPHIKSFEYVRVFGELNRFNGFNLLKVYNIQPIYDAHEIYHHILQAMVDTLSLERGPPPTQLISEVVRSREIDHVVSGLQEVTLSSNEGRIRQGSPRFSARNDGGTHKCEPLTPIQMDLFACISDQTFHENEELGINLEVAIQQIRNLHPQITSTDFWSSIEFLIEEGLILPVDDNHYKPI